MAGAGLGVDLRALENSGDCELGVKWGWVEETRLARVKGERFSRGTKQGQ